MGTDDLHKVRQTGRRERKAGTRAMKERQWLVVCEGEKTEPNYFRGLIDYLHIEKEGRDISSSVHIHGVGRNTESLMMSVEGFFEKVDEEYGAMLIPYGNIAVVFDRDSFGRGQFNHAISMGHMQEIEHPDIHEYVSAWSNESFELWILLHFQYFDSALDRRTLNDKLTDIFRKGGVLSKRESYSGSMKSKDSLFYDIIRCGGRVESAVKNARRLDSRFIDNKYADHNPRTKVYKLVELLAEEAKVAFGSESE
jgi:hypothetical protein